MIDDIEQKLQQALARELHLQCSLETLRKELAKAKEEAELAISRCGTIGNVLRYVHFVLTRTNEYEGDLCNSVQLAVDRVAEERETLRNERNAAIIDLTLAKQDTANALHELRSAVTVIEGALGLAKHGFTKLPILHLLDWLSRHSKQTKAPLRDPEAEAEQAKEKMLEEER